jgi:hypothetical protein
MEPLRGGKLATLPEPYEAQLKALRPKESVPAWAFRFLQTVPEVAMVLSGMSNMEQLQANIATWDEDKPLTQEEWDAILAIGGAMATGVPCTACHYCTNHLAWYDPRQTIVARTWRTAHRDSRAPEPRGSGPGATPRPPEPRAGVTHLSSTSISA